MQTTDISGRAMLASLSVKMWGNTRKDSKVSKETCARHGASDDAGRFSKTLLPPESLESLRQHVNAWRMWYREQTLPWMDDGARILTVQNWESFSSESKAKRQHFDGLVTAFVTTYPELVAYAPTRLNGMFDPSQYPPVGDIRSKFKAETKILPVPMASDFRVSLASEDVDNLRTEYEQAMAAAVQEAKRDVVQRLAQPLTHMAEILRKKDSPEGTALRPSLIANLWAAIDIIPALQLEKDSRLAEVLEASERLADTEIETLRLSPIARRDTAAEAERLVSQLEGYFGQS